jgi:hypothetical protein
MAVTTKTADLLGNMALRLVAISDAVYETDRDIGAELSSIASRLSVCSRALEERLEKYAKQASKE